MEPSVLLKGLSIEDKGLADRGYLHQVLSLLVDDPDPARTVIEQLSDRELIELCVGFLNLKLVRRNRAGGGDNALLHPTTLAECRLELTTYLDEEAKRLEKSSKEVMASFSKIATGLGAIDSVYRANPLVSYLDSINSFTNVTTRMSKQLLNPIQTYERAQINSWINLQTSLTSMYSQIFDVNAAIRESLDVLTRTVAAIDMPSVILGWQSVLDQNLVELAEEIREEYRTAFLIEANLQFMSDLSEQSIKEIVDDAMTVPKRQQSAHITRRLYSFTARVDFLDSIQKEIRASPRAESRYDIFEAIHRAHTNREFLLSVPVLLAQVEGLTTQFLAEMGLVRWNRLAKKWYEADPENGKYRLAPVYSNGVATPKKKRISLKGLGDLSKFLPKKTLNPPLPNTLPHLRDEMPTFRNQVMHGSMTNYGNSRMSSQLLLIARIISQQLRMLEDSGEGKN